MLADFRHALRRLRQTPGFTLTAVLTLALGIGATTAIFTLVQQVMLQSLPVTRPDQLWRIGDQPHCCNWAGYSQDRTTTSRATGVFFRGRHTSYSAQTRRDSRTWQRFRRVTSRWECGAPAQRDRRRRRMASLSPATSFRRWAYPRGAEGCSVDADDQEGAPPVAVMSFHAWQEKYGSDPSVVGSTYQINGRSFTIIGVAPAGFIGAKMASWGMPDIWMPLTTEPMIVGTTARIEKHARRLAGRDRACAPGNESESAPGAASGANCTAGWPATWRI